MRKTNIPLTFIYSSSSVEPFKDLVNTMLKTFDEHVLTVDDIFYYGVFCNDGVYATFDWSNPDCYDFEIPDILTDTCVKMSDKVSFVKTMIERIMWGEMEKPEWMIYIEQELSVNKFEQSPSTFLFVSSKDSRFTVLGEKLIEFLYSPNKLTTMLR